MQHQRRTPRKSQEEIQKYNNGEKEKLKQDINTYQIIFIVFYSSLLFSGSVQKIKLDILRKGPPPPQENLRRDSAVFNIFFGIQILTSDINCVPIRVKPQVAYISVSVQSGNFKSDEMFEKWSKSFSVTFFITILDHKFAKFKIIIVFLSKVFLTKFCNIKLILKNSSKFVPFIWIS